MNKKKRAKSQGFIKRKIGKNHQMVSPLNHFRGKNKNCSSLSRMISVETIIFCELDHFSLLKIVILKIYKSQVDPIIVGGRLRRPPTKMGISSGPMTSKFSKSTHFQNRDFEVGKIFQSRAPLKSGQVCKKLSSRRADRSGKR